MAKIFNAVTGRKVRRNLFNLSHERKFSFDMGVLTPILCQEVVPGDTFRVDSEVMMRFAPMLAPVMHRMDVYTHYWFVPYRLIWNEWEKFITGSDEVVFPKLVINSGTDTELIKAFFSPGSLADYLGVPIISSPPSNEISINYLPFRAYQLIWNEWYRDEDLQGEIQFSFDSGKWVLDHDFNTLVLRRRAWEKDYFTSARPWPQKGGEVNLPLTGNAGIEFQFNEGDAVHDSNGSYEPSGGPEGIDVYNTVFGSKIKTQNSGYLSVDNSKNLFVNLENVTAATITELRRAFQLQKWLERNARSGSRYTELLRAHFGVKSSDARLQRPEYLGGGKQPVSVSEVLQTSQSNVDSALGDMAGHGISVGRSNRFKAFFEEHGLVMGLISVLPRTAYQQGLPRLFSKFDKFDYFWPEFQHIGEQAIFNKEIYLNGTDADEETFGYAPRYAEYKYIPSSVHGDFKTNLDYWHLGRKFENRPGLNSSFVECNPSDRIFNVTDDDVQKLWCHLYNRVKALRPMAVFSEPGLIDH